MVFKTGDLGLGYYRDGSVKVSIAAALHDDWRPKPIQLNLNALIQVNEQNKSCAAAATLKKGSLNGIHHKRDRGLRAKGPLSCGSKTDSCPKAVEAIKLMKGQTVKRHGDSTTWLTDSIMADSMTHRKLGLWAIDTVNGNSWSSGSKFLEFTGADVALFQETKIREEDALRSAEDTAGRLGWKLSLSKACLGKNGGSSAGLGIAVKRNMGMALPDGLVDSTVESRFFFAEVRCHLQGRHPPRLHLPA